MSLVGGLVEALVLRHRVLGIDETGECQRRISYDVMFGFGNGQLAIGVGSSEFGCRGQRHWINYTYPIVAAVAEMRERLRW